MRMSISGFYKSRGVGDVLAGRVEQSLVKPGEEVLSGERTDARAYLRHFQVSNGMKTMLVKVGWKKDMVEKNVPSLDF